MSSWAGGYVSDIEYLSGFYRQQSPPHLALACLLMGVDGRLPGGTDRAHYMELGCGHGLNAVLVAASNPGWQVTAVDYNPAHIASGRALARAAQLENVSFWEADFGAMAGSAAVAALPEADVVSLHGVWSWVSPAVRAGIVRLLAEKVAPGGLVHVSYNALPGWQGALSLQRVVREAGQRGPGRSHQQVQAGLAFARTMLAAEARHFVTDPMLATLLKAAEDMPVNYLAHEYMNQHWSPCFHADVAAALSDAKLDWAGSAYMLEAFPDFLFSPAQRALFDQFDDPVMRELVKDTCLPRPLRHDAFIRGARRLGPASRNAALSEVVLTLAVPADDFTVTLDVPAGRATLGPGYKPVLDRLRAGPASVGELVSLMEGKDNPAELAGVLVGTSQAVAVTRPGAAQAPGADRLNRVLCGRVQAVTGPEAAGGLASAALGAALPVNRVTQFVCARLMDGEDAGAVGGWLDRLAADVPSEQRGALRGVLVSVAEKQGPVLRHAGVLPA